MFLNQEFRDTWRHPFSSSSSGGGGDHFICCQEKKMKAKTKTMTTLSSNGNNFYSLINSTIMMIIIIPVLLLIINQVPNAQSFQQATGLLQPIFIKNMDLLTVKENTPIGEIVYTLEAQIDQQTASDSTAANTRILYGIEGTQLFGVDKHSGQVRVVQQIDRELVSDMITFQVSATAVANNNNPNPTATGGQQPKLQYGPTTQLTITVLILDENDNPPRIERVRVGRNEFDSQALIRAGSLAGASPGAANPLLGQQRVSPIVRINISESAPVGSVLIDLIEAIDVDKTSSNSLQSICLECEPEFELRSVSILNDRLNSSLIVVGPLVHVPRKNVKQLQVIVNDGKFNTTILVEVTIEDVQNKAPQFFGSTTCIVQENAPIDKTIMVVQAVDGDAISFDDVNAMMAKTSTSATQQHQQQQQTGQLGRQILYDLVVANGGGADSGGLASAAAPLASYEEFKLHPLTGQLQVANRIDRESYLSSNGILTLRVRARELTINANTLNARQDDLYESILDKLSPYVDPSPDASNEIEITVILVDVNDNEPHWLNASEIASLNMNQSPNWYSSLPNDQDSGRIYQLQIKENSMAGSPITTRNEMFVYDLDNGENANFNLSLMDPFNLFDVEPKQVSGFALVTLKLALNNNHLNGRRTNNRLIDYENLNERSFIIQLIATETSTQERFVSKAQVQINVMDVNDNVPEFKEPTYHASIREDAQPGKSVLIVQATDRDEISKHLSYSLHGRSAYLFDINQQTGLITVARCDSSGAVGGGSGSSSSGSQRGSLRPQAARQPTVCIDYESQKSHHLMVEVSDGELSSKVPLTIFVDDSNDNPPVFSLPVVDVVIEEGSDKLEPPIKIEATDVDQSSVLSYSIVEGNFEGLFSINNVTGELQLTRPIRIAHDDLSGGGGGGPEGGSGGNGVSLQGSIGDYRYQQLNKMSLIIQATDGIYTTNGTIRIDVLDANDNSPKFLRPQYSVEIHESMSPGQIIVTVRAIDLDRGNNARVSYRLQRGSFGQFEIDENTGVISISDRAQDFDSSKRENYTLEVVAYDHGLVSKSSSVLVHVRVLDTNRKAPEFEPQIQRTSVLETTLNNTIIHRMQVASGQDHQLISSMLIFEPGPIEALDRNGQQVASSESERLESMFSVSTNTGDVMVNSALDYDFASYVNLTIYVSSRPPPSSPSTQLMAPLNGTDPPMVMMQGEETFNPRSVGYLIINVIDDNSNPPMFAAPWSPQQPELSYQMLEELPVGSILTQLVASDVDSKISHFKIEPPNEYFELTSAQSGVIVNKKLIDYDTLMSQTYLKPGSYRSSSSSSSSPSSSSSSSPSKSMLGTNYGNNIIQFNVYVYDSGQPQLSAKATVSVEISPVNDWDCKFEQSTYEARVKENTLPDTLVIQVRANDLDYGEQHNTVRYQLIGDHSDLFNIDPKTGLVTVSIKGSLNLDRERLIQNSFALTVLGRDEPSSFSTPTTGTSFSQSQFGVPKGARGGADKPPAVQHEGSGRSCSATLRIHVDDVNDNPPIFAQKLYEITAYDTDTVDVPLAKLLVRDDDAHTTSGQEQSQASKLLQVNSFKILSGNINDIFNITNTGLLYATKPLNELIAANRPKGSGTSGGGGVTPIQLRVQVKQQSASLSSGALSSTFTDECLVNINLVKINRYGPEWRFETPSKSSIAIEENSRPGTLVSQLKCVDRDFEATRGPSRLLAELDFNANHANSNLRYWIKENGSNVKETNEFRLDPISGNLTTKLELDRETREFYQLIVACEDNGRPQSLESVTPLFITILDVDDNKPEFLIPKTMQDSTMITQNGQLKQVTNYRMPTVSFSVEEHQSKGIPVGELKAIDRDLESSFAISYCLIDGNEFQEFSLDRVSGILYTNQTLDREKQSTYDLLVKAINDGSSCNDHIPNQKPLAPQTNSTSSLAAVPPPSSSSSAAASQPPFAIQVGHGRSKRAATATGSLISVRVEVLDINDNSPIFKKPIYRAGVHHRSLMNTLVTQVAAFDPDSGLNGTLTYRINEILMYKTTPQQQQQQQQQQSSSRKYEVLTEHPSVPSIGKPIKLIQYPFRIDQQGNLYSQQLLTQYQLMSMFVLQIEATEQVEPWRVARTKLEIYVYETSSQLKIRINLHPRLVETYRSEIETLLSNATKYTAIINRARSYHVPSPTDISSTNNNNNLHPKSKSPIDNRIDTNPSPSSINHHQPSISSSSSSSGNNDEPSFSNIHLIFVDNFRIVNPNLVMEKFDLTSAQLFMPQTLIQTGANTINNNNQDPNNPKGQQQQQQQLRQLQLNEVSSLIDKIALASVQTSEYHQANNPAHLAGIDWLESPSAIYVTLTILLLVIGFLIFLFSCCCTSRIKDHIIKVAMDKLVKQQTLQSKINEQMLAATNQSGLGGGGGGGGGGSGGSGRTNVGINGTQEYILQQGGFMSSFDVTKSCIANNNENISILQRAMESGEFIDPNYTTLNGGHMNMGAHFYDASELDHQQQQHHSNEPISNGYHQSMKHHHDHELGGTSKQLLNGSSGSLAIDAVAGQDGDDDDHHHLHHNSVGGVNGDLNNGSKNVQKSSKIPTTNGNGVIANNSHQQQHNNARQRQQIPKN